MKSPEESILRRPDVTGPIAFNHVGFYYNDLEYPNSPVLKAVKRQPPAEDK